jgi:FMN phosphatase YigB (HAD superfamily)
VKVGVSTDDIELIARTGWMVSSIEGLVQQKRVISFDVFDTLLARRLLEPSDVFGFIEKKFAIPGFAEARVKAERLARKRFGTDRTPEVSLDEIYSILRDMLQGLAFGPADEIEVEAGFLFADPVLGRIVELARKHGKRVIAISDMYLGKDQITDLLARNGIRLDAVYSSCDHRRQGLGKFNGRLFLHVAKQEGCLPSDIVHFGDNRVSDVKNALECGIVGVLVRARREFIANGETLFMPPHTGHPTVTASLVLGQIVGRLSGFSHEASAIYSYGYNVAGPIVAGFCKFIAEQAGKDGVERVLLMARDGYIIRDALNILKLPVPSYDVFPISRRMAIFPLLAEEPGLFETMFLNGQPAKISPRSLWLQLDLDLAPILNHPELDTLMPVARIRNLFSEELAQAVHDERALLSEHLRKWCGDNPAKVAFVDVGWGLTTLQALDHLTEAKPKGYFVGIRNHAHQRRGLRGYLFSGANPEHVQNTVMSAAELIEVIFSFVGAGFSKLARIDGEAVPLRGETRPEEAVRNLFVADLQEGALQFLRDIAPVIDDLDCDELCEFNRAAITQLISAPSDREYRALAAIPHAATATHSAWETIGDIWKATAPQVLPVVQAVTPPGSLLLQKLRNYELVSSRFIQRLVERTDLDRLDWRREMRRHPFKIGYWNAVRRYARRARKK